MFEEEHYVKIGVPLRFLEHKIWEILILNHCTYGVYSPTFTATAAPPMLKCPEYWIREYTKLSYISYTPNSLVRPLVVGISTKVMGLILYDPSLQPP